jgi:hypothetical protein
VPTRISLPPTGPSPKPTRGAVFVKQLAHVVEQGVDHKGRVQGFGAEGGRVGQGVVLLGLGGRAPAAAAGALGGRAGVLPAFARLLGACASVQNGGFGRGG